jgi:hypothetical protein
MTRKREESCYPVDRALRLAVLLRRRLDPLRTESEEREAVSWLLDEVAAVARNADLEVERHDFGLGIGVRGDVRKVGAEVEWTPERGFAVRRRLDAPVAVPLTFRLDLGRVVETDLSDSARSDPVALVFDRLLDLLAPAAR